MKTIIPVVLVVAFFFSCKSADNLSNAEQIANITKIAESGNYTFVANIALPMSGRSINLSSTYFLKVRKDTIESYLPYYGRAYVAPAFSDEGPDFVNASPKSL